MKNLRGFGNTLRTSLSQAMRGIYAVSPFLLFTVFVLGVGAVIWEVPRRQAEQAQPKTAKERVEIENASRDNLLKIVQSLGGLAFVLTAYYASRNLQVAEKNRELAEDKQVAERFTRAVEMLGDQERIEVRLGGIYSLERIAKDAPEDYHWIVMEVLTAFVRENLPVEEAPNNIDTDIYAVLTVIERRKNKNLEQALLNLCGVNLSYAELRGITLLGVNLSLATLSYADLKGADLRAVDFSDAILSAADLREANLRGADFSDASLSSADLSSADLSGANFHLTDLSNATLRSTDLSNATLRSTDLSGAILSAADLSGADLRGAYFNDPRLNDANLSGIDRGGQFRCGTDLSKANLRGADLRQARNLNPEQVKAAKNWEQAIYNAALRQQLGLDREESGGSESQDS